MPTLSVGQLQSQRWSRVRALVRRTTRPALAVVVLPATLGVIAGGACIGTVLDPQCRNGCLSASESGAQIGADPDTDFKPTAGSDSDVDSDTGTGAGPDSDSDADSGTDPDTGSGQDADSDGDPGADPTPDTNGDCEGPLAGSSGTNPLFTDRYTADPAAFVHDCTFHIVCGHDEGQNGFVMWNWYLLSSTDMVNWTDNVGGPILKVSDFAWADANAWASHLTERNGKFYWYVPINQRGGAMTIGVAVADSVTGPYKDAIGGPLVSDAIEMQIGPWSTPGDTPYTIDPAVLVDDDGQAYLYYGSFWRVIVAKLNDDMISLDGGLQEMQMRGAPADGGFWEAPYVAKHEGTYYFIFAAGQNPATIDYATSDSPTGPWQYRGRIIGTLPNQPGQDAATNHAGVAEFAGQWYIVYHVSNGPNGGGTYRREVAIEKMHFNTDGTIERINPSSGLSF